MFDTSMMPPPPRPARPIHVDPALIDEVRAATAMERRRIYNAWKDDAGRIYITEVEPRRTYVWCPPDAPDALGQTGLLYDRMRSFGNAQPGRNAKIFFDPAERWHEPWTAADLDLEASRLREKPEARNVRGEDGIVRPSYGEWVGSDPVRARALWLHLARARKVAPGAVIHREPWAGWARKVIFSSDWVAPSEFGLLDRDPAGEPVAA
ncbi:hypothetical protein [Parafrankia sp. BMG5.11]|uniref:hypothetical protein n=1 Tax=Parafrankia sp. BMG5.11 TaxID=222540 RepID=UPI00103C98C7|nr:hypothetical protein [Parafrankia sp. BMG5.11]TCJ36866.1 hypothetical protein E0504_21555 [Parafrankia sp. BMG5.11]